MIQERQAEHSEPAALGGPQPAGPSMGTLDRAEVGAILRADNERRMQAASPYLNGFSIGGETMLCQAPVQRDPNVATDSAAPVLAANSAVKTASRLANAARVAGADAPRIPALPSNPGAGVMEYTPGGQALRLGTPTGLVEGVHRPAANVFTRVAIEGLSGSGSRPAEWNHMGSATMPAGMFSRTPDVTFRIDYRGRGLEAVSVPIPPVSGGQRVDFYQNGHQIQARSGRDTYTLYRTTNSILPDWMAAGWEWRKN